MSTGECSQLPRNLRRYRHRFRQSAGRKTAADGDGLAFGDRAAGAGEIELVGDALLAEPRHLKRDIEHILEADGALRNRSLPKRAASLPDRFAPRRARSGRASEEIRARPIPYRKRRPRNARCPRRRCRETPHGAWCETARASALLADERQQGHEPRPLDRRGHSVLAGGGAAALAAADDLALAAGELGEQFEVFVIDVHRPRTFAVDEDRIFLLAADLDLVTLARRTGRSFHAEFIARRKGSIYENERRTKIAKRRTSPEPILFVLRLAFFVHSAWQSTCPRIARVPREGIFDWPNTRIGRLVGTSVARIRRHRRGHHDRLRPRRRRPGEEFARVLR